jgi:hypothetical protein
MYLIDTAKLEVDTEVLFIKSLQSRVEQPAQKGALDLLHNLCPGLLGIVFCYGSTELVIIEIVLPGKLVGGALDESKFGDRYPE